MFANFNFKCYFCNINCIIQNFLTLSLSSRSFNNQT